MKSLAQVQAQLAFDMQSSFKALRYARDHRGETEPGEKPESALWLQSLQEDFSAANDAYQKFLVGDYKPAIARLEDEISKCKRIAYAIPRAGDLEEGAKELIRQGLREGIEELEEFVTTLRYAMRLRIDD